MEGGAEVGVLINDRDSSVAVLEAQTVLGAAANGHDSALLHIDVEAIQNGPVLQLEQSFLGILFAVANDGRVVGVQKSADRAQGLRGASQASDDSVQRDLEPRQHRKGAWGSSHQCRYRREWD